MTAAQVVACEVFSWCEGHWDTGRDLDHFATIGSAQSGDSKVKVMVQLMEGETMPTFSVEINDWEIAADQIDNETQDMVVIAGKLREFMRGWRRQHFPDIE